MINLNEGGLRRSRQISEEVSPMENVGNLVDAMLVFACGLLLALVTFWNVDLPTITEVQDMKEVNDLDIIPDTIDTSGTSYNQLGTVFEDPDTGKMYLVTEEEAE